MKRRKLVAGLGALASGATVLGSGAFTSVEADRSVLIETEDDSGAFLRMRPRSPNFRAATGDGVVEFNIPGLDDEAEGKGVAPDSVYVFGGILELLNQGTNTVQVRSEYTGDGLSNIALANDGRAVSDTLPVLDPGDSDLFGLLIDSTGSDVGSFEENLTIIAETPDK
jgi:hypothetical protein